LKALLCIAASAWGSSQTQSAAVVQL